MTERKCRADILRLQLDGFFIAMENSLGPYSIIIHISSALQNNSMGQNDCDLKRTFPKPTVPPTQKLKSQLLGPRENKTKLVYQAAGKN